ncbi:MULTISPECIES: Na+/H+ antiporter subunit G [unclassified Limnobacter]|jgi:multicomponent K+:H+ antiporter subunit G|uniref:Na+/H+ antiporter subunit G n=1 Tax=unclassified Limnobacter TaxID=2630203 RepID=UPI000C5F428E|nr:MULTISPECIES: Na+/H+ antiporter subunit G [unclassified Limnobacter]MAZ08185.1 Na+/H+ antiporter subunit G [Sutterellaceae bacterium]|tara:strand:+ start:10809 stop:11201 length:393 start_codon:yes stop_codon:yes gene_type:complete|eukprot:gene17485-biopygen15412
MMAAAPFWVEVLVGVLLIVSGVFTLSSAVGIVRFNSFFQRMHPTALAYSFSAWIVTLASIVYFSAVETSVTVHPWLIIVFLSITVPVTTIFLARTNLFRNRISKEPETEVPPPLSEVASPMPKKKPAHLD